LKKTGRRQEAPRIVRALAALGALTATQTGCLGQGTARIDAPCREMRSAIAYEMLKDSPSIPVVDVRRPAEVTAEEGRLRHSFAIPLDRLSARISDIERFRDTTVIVFGRDFESGRRACQLLSGRGFKYVVFISDGAEGWFQNGLPSATSSPRSAR
jgi:rhodanese-related sulfurtransferase